MARVVALVPDLLFGSRVQASLAAAGHDVRLVGDAAAAGAAGAGSAAQVDAGAEGIQTDVLIVDLTSADFDGIAALESLRAGGQLGRTRTLAFYSHVDADTRARAVSAGFDVVVPRSRMAREGAQLVSDLLG